MGEMADDAFDAILDDLDEYENHLLDGSQELDDSWDHPSPYQDDGEGN